MAALRNKMENKTSQNVTIPALQSMHSGLECNQSEHFSKSVPGFNCEKLQFFRVCIFAQSTV